MSKNNFNINEGEVDVNDLLEIIKRRWKTLFLISLSSILISVPYSLTRQKIWEGNFQIVLKQENNDNNSFLSQARQISGTQLPGIDRENTLKTEVTILRSPSVLQPVFKLAKKLKKSKGENVENLKYSQWLKNNLVIKLQEGTSVLQINYKSSDKNHILQILEKISKTYQNYSSSGRENYLQYEINYAAKQLEEFKKKSKFSNREFDFFGIKYGIISKANSPLSRLSEINQELIRRKQLFKDNDPSIKSLTEERDFLKNYIETTANGRISLPGNAQLTKEEAQRIILKYIELKREADRNSQIVNNLEDQLITLKMNQAKKIQPWKLISIPTLQDSPIAPKKKVIVGLSTFFGFLTGLITALIQDKRKGIIYNFNEFEKLSNFPIIHRINSKEKVQIETHQKLLIEAFCKNKDSLGIVAIGEFKNNYLEFYKSFLKKNFKDKSIIISNSLLDTKGCSSILIIANLGLLTRSELGIFIEQLKLQENEILGAILINSKAK